MFTGIIEAKGIVKHVKAEGGNVRFTIACPFAVELKEGQSISHNGVCLTVEKIHRDQYEVVAVEETLRRTNLGKLKDGDAVNLERSMELGDRLDGHIVQGHVDETALCKSIDERDGSRWFTFTINPESSKLVIEKGSVCINGVSLTVAELTQDRFSVAVIPYTYEHTNFNALKTGGEVNLEFDVLGKYVLRQMESRKS